MAQKLVREHDGAEQAADRQAAERQSDGALLVNRLAQRFDHRRLL